MVSVFLCCKIMAVCGFCLVSSVVTVVSGFVSETVKKLNLVSVKKFCIQLLEVLFCFFFKTSMQTNEEFSATVGTIARKSTETSWSSAQSYNYSC